MANNIQLLLKNAGFLIHAPSSPKCSCLPTAAIYFLWKALSISPSSSIRNTAATDSSLLFLALLSQPHPWKAALVYHRFNLLGLLPHRLRSPLPLFFTPSSFHSQAFPPVSPLLN